MRISPGSPRRRINRGNRTTPVHRNSADSADSAAAQCRMSRPIWMELAPDRALFARFVYGDDADGGAYELDFARVLEDAVEVMRHRQSALRGRLGTSWNV